MKKKLVARLRSFEEYIVCFSMTMSLNAFGEDQENSAFTEKKKISMGLRLLNVIKVPT